MFDLIKSWSKKVIALNIALVLSAIAISYVEPFRLQAEVINMLITVQFFLLMIVGALLLAVYRATGQLTKPLLVIIATGVVATIFLYPQPTGSFANHVYALGTFLVTVYSLFCLLLYAYNRVDDRAKREKSDSRLIVSATYYKDQFEPKQILFGLVQSRSKVGVVIEILDDNDLIRSLIVYETVRVLKQDNINADFCKFEFAKFRPPDQQSEVRSVTDQFKTAKSTETIVTTYTLHRRDSFPSGKRTNQVDPKLAQPTLLI